MRRKLPEILFDLERDAELDAIKAKARQPVSMWLVLGAKGVPESMQHLQRCICRSKLNTGKSLQVARASDSAVAVISGMIGSRWIRLRCWPALGH